MITKINIKNFKGIYDLTFSPKNNNAFIYGENGSGKSAFVDALYFIFKSVRTIYDERRVYSLPSRVQGFYPELSSDDLRFRIQNENENLCEMLRDSHRINSADGPSFTLEFERNNVNGCYFLLFDLDKIKKESLIIDGVRAFEIEGENVFINSKVVTDEAYRNELKERVCSSYGANSLMSILYADIKGTSMNYYRCRISHELSEIIDFFSSVSLLSDDKRIAPMLFGSGNLILGYSDFLGKKERDNLIKLMEYYRPYLLPAYSKIFYRTFIASGREMYELMLEKNGMIIPLSFESKGIKALFEIFPYFLSVLLGGVSIIDDFDEHLSDGIVLQLLSMLEKEGDGELIATFRASGVLSKMNKESIYKISDINSAKVIDLYDGKEDISKKRINENKKILIDFKDSLK